MIVKQNREINNVEKKNKLCYNESVVMKGIECMTIADIARLAGVSNAAVSRYFNNGYISEEKREAIRKVIEETGYQPSLQAQTLRTGKTKTIGVIAPKMSSASLGSVVEGVLSVLNENGYQMLLSVTQNNYEKELEYLKSFDDKRVDGVILIATVFTPEHKKILKNMTVPVIVLGQKFDGHYCVYHDDYHGMYELTKLVIEKGRKNIGYIGVLLQDKAAGVERLRGFKDAMTEQGLDVQDEYCLVGKFSVQSGYDKAKEMLKNYQKIDGLICATDEIAIGAMQYILEKGISVPEDIYIAGQGDSILARVAGHSISTVHYSYEKSGEVAANMLIEILTTGETAFKEIMLGYYIVDNATYGVKKE